MPIAPQQSAYVVSPPASFGLYAELSFLTTVLLSLFLVFGFFTLFPSLDVAVSHIFYNAGLCGDAAVCGGFPAANSASLAALRSLFYVMPFAVFTGILLFNANVFVKHNISFWRDGPVIAALVGCFCVGPGLIVNTLLKQHVMRSRPRDVTVFGGDFAFVPVGQWGGSCGGNCSFVSGEASIAPLMVLCILLFPKQWQKLAMLVLLPASLAMAMLRVVVGAHYVSDVILGYGITIAVFCVIANVLKGTVRQNSNSLV